ncbi:MAG: polysaccharide deacetylase family protein [Promethearchaeota archaeon]
MTAKIPSIIEKMGYEPDDKVVIVHIDDMGASHAVNQASFECLEFGVATCGSVLSGANWFPEVVRHYHSHPNLDLGIHLSLTSEYELYRWRPLSTGDPKSGLIDDEGYLWRTMESAVQFGTPEAAEAEMRAQVQMALNNKMNITHLDFHMISVLMPKFIDHYLKVAQEFQVPALVPKMDQNLLVQLGVGDLFDFFSRKVQKLAEKGYPIIDHIMAASFDTPNKVQVYKGMIRNIKPGLTHLLFHPGKKSPELTAMAQETASGRYQDYLAFTSTEIKEVVDQNEIKLIGCREIQQYMKESHLF